MIARGLACHNGLNHVGAVALYSLAQVQQFDECADPWPLRSSDAHLICQVITTTE